MTTNDYGKLVKLGDVGETVADETADVRGRQVIDKDGRKLGKIDALLVDDKERKVRMLEVETGGFLGLGEQKSLIPVDAIVSIDADEVHIDQTGATVTAAPHYDPVLVEPEFFEDVYGHYGILPFWGLGYIDSSFPHYAVGD
ncbi:PRC-barrel domain-containing protein [Lacisediminihabitans sp. FW035]